MTEQFLPFFTISSQAAAALLGLLFVALAVDTSMDKTTRIKQYIISENAFFSFALIFIVSLLASMPDDARFMIGGTIILSLTGMALLIDRSRRSKGEGYVGRDILTVGLTIISYGVLLAASILMLLVDDKTFLLKIFCADLSFIFVMSLIRAWRTLIIGQKGSF